MAEILILILLFVEQKRTNLKFYNISFMEPCTDKKLVAKAVLYVVGWVILHSFDDDVLYINS